MDRHPEIDGVVLFLGFPALADTDLARLKPARAKRVVVSAALPGYEVLLREGHLHLAIVPRPVSADAPPPAAASLREAFDRDYVILRPDP
jgi:hypothetical protein